MHRLKMEKEHFVFIKEAIENTATLAGGWGPILEQYKRREIPRGDKVKDINKRLRWDILDYSVKAAWICDNLYPYIADTHIDNALKKIVPEIKE